MTERASRRRVVRACLELSRRQWRAYASLLKDVCLSVEPLDVLASRLAGCQLLVDARDVDGSVADSLCARGLTSALTWLYEGTGGFEAAATSARRAAGSKVVGSHSYGEIGPECFLRTFREARRFVTSPRVSFCDLGSGRGQTVFMAALVDETCDASGVEVVAGLHEIALAAKARFGSGRGTVTFHHADLEEDTPWTAADLVFLNWICFDKHLVDALTSIAAHALRPGAILVTFTTAIQSSHFVVLRKFLHPTMPWGGPCTVFVHKKLDALAHHHRITFADPTPFDDDQALALPRPGEPYEPSDTMDSLDVQPAIPTPPLTPHQRNFSDFFCGNN
ncbi:hypothetical protein CTAYLR_001384 [Chrysophaeum taylorii]|uniref:DOT1 domain-containing protein n=1 Tax=Chrysophaeum taylorii TaxID=2483200 RepID=A0AAD7U773_9STRA|nr:hypothetical protein CTAYLR_001384 [Chrysophaeum taylorii]